MFGSGIIRIAQDLFGPKLDRLSTEKMTKTFRDMLDVVTDEIVDALM